MLNSWDMWALQLAQFVSTRSKDPSTKVGAVITFPNHRIVSLAYNGLPQRIVDSDERLSNREFKYELIIHAEANAMLFAKVDMEGAYLYTWPYPPCSRCAAMIIQVGICRVVSPALPSYVKERWGKSCELAEQIFKEAGIEVVYQEN